MDCGCIMVRDLWSCNALKRNSEAFRLLWIIKYFISLILTIRKQAPISTAFILTSMSIGNCMPKLSVSVKTSFNRPLHCFLIWPIGFPVPSFPLSLRKKYKCMVRNTNLPISKWFCLVSASCLSLNLDINNNHFQSNSKKLPQSSHHHSSYMPSRAPRASSQSPCLPPEWRILDNRGASPALHTLRLFPGVPVPPSEGEILPLVTN